MVRQIIAAAMAVALLAAPTRAEPQPGTVIGLDTSSPQAAAESFIASWALGDHFVTYLTLDPELRQRVIAGYQRLDFKMFYGDAFTLTNEFQARLAAAGAESLAVSGPGSRFPFEPGAIYAAIMEAGLAEGYTMIAMQDYVDGRLVATPGDDPDIAFVAMDEHDGGGALVLRRSPEGRWRILGLDGREDTPRFWQYMP